MANETMVLLEKIVVPSGGASSVTFTSIPQSYTDLNVLASTRSTGDQASVNYCQLRLELNGNTSNYSDRLLYGIPGTGAGSLSYTNAYISWAGASTDSTATASTFSNVSIYIPNYASSNNKSISSDGVTESNATNSILTLDAGLWANTSAITSLKFTLETGNFAEYSTFYLYGVAKQGVTPTNAPAATGGDSIVFDGTYWIHTFYSSGTFTPKKALTCDYLVVAGGGGGGGNRGSGGGAGGLRSTVTATGGGGSLESALSLTAQAYTVTVGAGGAGSNNGVATSGNNSIFNTITSTGGGSGRSYDGGAGTTGGSGGGAAGNSGSSTPTGGAGTANQGYAGGNGAGGNEPTNYGNSGGGGGAGAAGTNATLTVMGAGGNGVATSISGSSVTYAGGGGGTGDYRNASVAATTSGGTGGGATGRRGANGDNGSANTGGGGGGGGFNNSPVTFYTGGTGGSGIVIVRYAA